MPLKWLMMSKHMNITHFKPQQYILNTLIHTKHPKHHNKISKHLNNIVSASYIPNLIISNYPLNHNSHSSTFNTYANIMQECMWWVQIYKCTESHQVVIKISSHRDYKLNTKNWNTNYVHLFRHQNIVWLL